MSEEKNQIEEPETPETNTEEIIETPKRRRFFTRRNTVISSGLLTILLVLLAISTVVFYRYGVFDNYIKAQFVAKMNRIGMTFDADVFRVTVSPLQLELKNATFNDKLTGEKLFFVSDAKFGLTVQNLYDWQLNRDISIDSTDIDGATVWVKFDENGKSNFSNLQLVEESNRINFTYSSLKFSLKNGLVHFGDISRKIDANARNIVFFLEPENAAMPDDQKRYKFDFTSVQSNFIYDEHPIEPVDIRAKGIADHNGAEISELKLTTPIGESSLNGKLTDWKSPKYDLNIISSVDLTQASTLLPIGTPLRGIANFEGKVSGEGENYHIDGEINSEALAASGIYLKALNVNATVAGTNSMYEANGKAVAELLTFEDFKIDFLSLVGNIRGTGTDFKWLGELQAAAAESPLGTLGGLFISDAVAEYKEKNFSATLGNVRAKNFFSKEADVQNLQANNIRVNSKNGVTDVNAPNVRAQNVKTKDVNLQNVAANNVRVKDQSNRTDIQADNLQAQTVQTKDTRLKNLQANNIRIQRQNGTTDINANNLRAGQVDANGAVIGDLNATNITIRDNPNETIVYSDNLKVAKIETDAVILGSLNIAGVRLTIRRGVIEATSGNIDAGKVTLAKSNGLPTGGTLENVKIYKPVFILEPSGRYRASADMSLGGGVLGSVTLGAATANVVVNNDQAMLTNLSADVMDGRINGEATIAFTTRNRSNITADFSNLDLAKLLALQGGRIVPIEGNTTGKVNLSFAGTNFKTASGTLFADINANAGTQQKGLIPVTGRIEATATNGLFNLDIARLTTEKSVLNATGKFDLNGNNSNLNIALNSTDASEIDRVIRVLEISPDLDRQLDDYQAEFAGNLKFNGTLTGNVSDPIIAGNASLDSLRLRGRELGALSSDIFVSPIGVEFKNGLLQEPNGGGNLAFNVNIPSIGTNNISVDATLNKINTGNFIAALPIKGSLPEQFKDFQAQTSGTINLRGLPSNMEGEANISSGAGTINGEVFDGFDARATFAGNLVKLENLNVRFGDGFVKANGTYETDTTAFNFNVESKSVAFARVRPFIPNSSNLPNINGIIDLQASATGKTSDSRTYNISFNGTGQNVVFENSTIGNVAFVGKTENQQLNANFTINFGEQPQVITANVNFADENLPFRAETEFNNTELAPFITIFRSQFNQTGDVSFTGRATGKVLLAGNLSALDATGNRVFTGDNLSGSANFSQLALQIGETPLSATETVSVRFNTSEIVFESAKFAGGGSNLEISGTKALNDNGINSLALVGTINLRILNALSPNYFFAGLTNVDVRLTGPNKTARLNGSATPQNASFSAFFGSQRFSLERIQGRIIFSSNQAQIDQLNGFLGGGRVSISGGAMLTDSLEMQAFRFNLSGSNVTIPLPKDFITTGDAEIEFNGRRNENNQVISRLSGRINARRSVYTNDIDLADIIGGRREGSLEQAGTSSSSSSFFGTPQIDLLIEGRDALVVRNNIADLTASASLRVTGDINYPQISGRISANSGTIIFRNDRYEIQRGELLFPPNSAGIQPIINLRAESEINGYQITVNLNGDLTDTESLSAVLSSNPALPQADIVSLITTGSLSNSEGGIPTLAQSGINTATEILADAIINKPLSKATDKLFGLNRFEIDPIISGQRLNPTARLTVGRQINRNLLITYSTNLSGDQNQVLALEYRVSNRLSFVAQYEQRALSNVTRNNNVFSFEIRLRKRF
ncbi:hypothetical protein BH10ACI1_BH10ACI1_15200 [soil metagenome]